MTSPSHTSPLNRREEYERRIAAVNALYDQLDYDRSDSRHWSDRGQSGSFGDYERAAALARVNAEFADVVSSRGST